MQRAVKLIIYIDCISPKSYKVKNLYLVDVEQEMKVPEDIGEDKVEGEDGYGNGIGNDEKQKTNKFWKTPKKEGN